MKTRALSLTTLLLLLSGCSAESSFEGVSAPREDGTPAGTLRLDVTPPTTEGAILLQQSHLLPPDAYEGVGLELLGTRSVSGVLTAQVARGWSFGAPTSPEPLVAGILALPEGDLQGAIAQSGEDGAFVLSFPAYHTPIEVAFVPVDAGMAPILVLEAPTYDRTGWNQEILPGIPVYGRVTGLVDGLEQPLAGITLRISQVVGGQAVSSAAFTTDRTGWYVARVQDLGEYTIEVEGGASTAADRMVPTLSVPVLVEADEGVELPITLGHVQAASADGSVVDFDGDRVVNALIRFTSVSLDSGVGALTVETDTNGEGRFITDLLPGVYDIEIMPAYDTNVTASPARYDRQRISDGINLPNLLVQAPARLSGRVLNASEDPAADVQVVATEVGFGGNVYFARTGQDGAFDFPVTDVPLTVTLTPSRSEDGAVTTVDVAEPGAIGAFVLDAGVPLDGKVTYEGTDIAYASVDVYDAGSGLLLGRTISDEAGYFSLRVSLPEASLDTADTGADTAADTGADTAADTGADTADTAR